jgi:hypothetical protein
MEAMSEKKYTLRGLEASDFFLMTRILSKVGVKQLKSCIQNDEVKDAIKAAMGNEGNEGEQNADADIASVGISVAFEIAGVVLENLENCEKDVYKLLSRLSGLKEDAIEHMPISDFSDMVFDVIQHEDFRDFFTAVIKRFK